jgi:hypothetical protein
MKPKEFDELIRQKFDQNDFEYNPRNWDRLEDQLDGRAKKRSIIMWWLMPVAGIAASVALAMGVTQMFHFSGSVRPDAGGGMAKNHKTEIVRPAQDGSANAVTITYDANTQPAAHLAITNSVSRRHTNKKHETEAKEEVFGINLENAISNQKQSKKVNVNLLDAKNVVVKKEKENKKAEPIYTFKPEVEKKKPTLSLILTGGYNNGTEGVGYSAGAAIRKNISENVFIEGNVGYVSNSTTQAMPYYKPKTYDLDPNGHIIMTGAGKTSGDVSSKQTGDDTKKPPQVTINGPRYINNVAFDLSYAELHPSIGVKIFKAVSIGAGPDFQRALADTRPVASETNVGTNQAFPLFDVGLIGKTEVSITRNIKAGAAYRKGVNSMLAPAAGYIDRDYVQFQVKCAVFNK